MRCPGLGTAERGLTRTCYVEMTGLFLAIIDMKCATCYRIKKNSLTKQELHSLRQEYSQLDVKFIANKKFISIVRAIFMFFFLCVISISSETSRLHYMYMYFGFSYLCLLGKSAMPRITGDFYPVTISGPKLIIFSSCELY